MRITFPLLAALLLTTGCAGSTRGGALESDRAFRDARIQERRGPDGLIVVAIDTDGDGKPDTFNTYRPRANASRLLVQKEMDLNRDGRIDVRAFFDDAGELEREEIDSDFDGKVDRIDHYQQGRRVMSETDTTGNGRMDVFSYFERGPRDRMVITIKERDTTGDGLIDYWERFDERGQVVKTGRDTDGDGIMDEREE